MCFLLMSTVHYDIAFFRGQAVEVEDAVVYLFIGLVDLLGEG